MCREAAAGGCHLGKFFHHIEGIMRRTLIGAGVGMACGLLALAGVGAWGGSTFGSGSRFPPGWEASVMGAFLYVAYFWWLAGTVGVSIGGLAGLVSWLVRPRPPIKSTVSCH